MRMLWVTSSFLYANELASLLSAMIVSQENEHEIMPSLMPLVSIQEIEIYQKIAFRLVHTIRQKEPDATRILEICFKESIFSNLLRETFPNADIFQLKIEKDTELSDHPSFLQLIATYKKRITDPFDIILISPSGQLNQYMEDLLSFCYSMLRQGGLFAGILLGSDTFLELSTCINWLNQQATSQPRIHSFPTRSMWEQTLHKYGLSLWKSKEEWFRYNFANSQELFQLAAKLGILETVSLKQDPKMSRFFHEWMKTYDRGFRTNSGKIYATYHLIEQIGYIL